jgi:hypothetical protein
MGTARKASRTNVAVLRVVVVVVLIATTSMPATEAALYTATRIPTKRRTAAAMSLHATRRDLLVLLPVLLRVDLVAQPLAAAHADGVADFDKIQDLLRSSDNTAVNYDYSTGRPKYLTEPTEEFKENEIKSSDFKRQQLQQKQQFSALLQKLADDPNDETLLVQDLDQMTALVGKYAGLPLGISKDYVVQQVRARKRKKYWPTNVEIAYQSLLQEVRFQQSPNKERDMDNPM